MCKLKQSVVILKPDALENKTWTRILEEIENAGYVIDFMFKLKLNQEQAEEFYKIHQKKKFFNELIQYITRGPVILLLISSSKVTDLILSFRNFIGHTNPQEAKEGSIRNKYGQSLAENVIHASDSKESAERELKLVYKLARECFK